MKTITNFHPQFTYPIFGDDEQIFGYQDLQISLRYNANDMRPNLAITYKKKFQAVGETEATNVDEILHEYLPEGTFSTSYNWPVDMLTFWISRFPEIQRFRGCHQARPRGLDPAW